MNWKKILLFSTVSAFAPTLQQWAQAAQSGTPAPFTFETVVAPAIPNLVLMLAALFSNPRTAKK